MIVKYPACGRYRIHTNLTDQALELDVDPHLLLIADRHSRSGCYQNRDDNRIELVQILVHNTRRR